MLVDLNVWRTPLGIKSELHTSYTVVVILLIRNCTYTKR